MYYQTLKQLTNQFVEGKEWMVNGQQFSSKELYSIYPIFVDHTEAPKMFWLLIQKQPYRVAMIRTFCH